MKKELGKMERISVLLVIVLFLNLPVISALEISNVRAEEITESSAAVKWETDEPADSFVSYGTDKGDLKTTGDAKLVQQHGFSFSSLLSSTEYYFKVKSGEVEDDNEGNFYSFKTLEADTTPPAIEAEAPSQTAGNKLNVEGWTEAGAEVRIYVNGMMRGRTTAEEEKEQEGEGLGEGGKEGLKGKFSFTEVSLLGDEWNEIKIEAEDKSGNIGEWAGKVFADNKKPEVEIEELPEVIDKNEILLKGKISEKCSIEIFVNERSVFKGEGDVLESKISLQEGKNEIKVAVKDEAGWEVIKELVVNSDTAPPQVRFELEAGGEYYQGRAVTAINGETEPGATVYLYIYRRLGYEYKPEFDKAWAKTTADEEGKFTFKDVDFECITCGLDRLAPKEVPAELIDVIIPPVEVLKEVQRWTYYIYAVAEDKTGKTGSTQRTANVNTCYSAEWAFSVESLAKFQAPFRLDPGLLDEGREVVSAWFKLDYHGEGIPKTDPATGTEIEPAFKIINVHFEKACTPGMEEDDAFKVGCKVLPRAPKILPNADKTAYFVTWNLHRADELSKAEDDFWNEFRKRMLMFPLKIIISYQERAGETVGMSGEGVYSGWSETKTQSTCYDLGYFVDIPIDSQKMLPDWLVDEGVEGLEWTIEKIDTVMPYLEKAVIVSGIACIAGFVTKMIVKYLRVFTAKLESYFGWVKLSEKEREEKGCPPSQYGLYLQSTIDGWKNLKGEQLKKEHALPFDIQDPSSYEDKILDKRCPSTASMWKLEAALDQLYRWSCDRFLCRKVPAGWTSKKEEDEIKTVILKQEQCAVTSAGVPLIELKDCQKFIEKETVAVLGRSSVAEAFKVKNPSYFCYRTPDGDLYINDDSPSAQKDIPEELKEKRVKKLFLMGNIGTKLTGQTSLKTDLLAYQPPGSDQFIVFKDISCDALCRSEGQGYRADSNQRDFIIGGIASKGKGDEKGCYSEDADEFGKMVLKDANKNKIKEGNVYPALSYTNDCFIDLKTNEFKQCVCRADEKAEKRYEPTDGAKTWLRTAAKEENGVAEPWSYREATIFGETGGKIGIYYPELRYYSGRDLSGAFGADYLLDYLRPEGQEEVHEINPSEHLGTFQSICLSGINARLALLKSILQGLRDCLYEAKYTELHNAGTCKTLFSQHVCGLIYKLIAHFYNGCHPYSVKDKTSEGAFADVGEVVKAGLSSIPETMQYSIDEIQEDYGNAKLNEFFATGVQGFAQSMCMVAFGFDWPMGFDFIMDVAYAVPMETNIVVPIANRELATYNPKQGTAIYNYDVAATILPGCKIRGYRVYLKCIGPEDKGRPGVQCGTQGCDCINLISGSATGAERIHLLEGGVGFEIKQGQPKSVEIPSPQKVDSLYRYDHLVVELQLDRFEEAETCFDEGYMDGKFYFPIVDVSAPLEVACQVDITTGRYYCPELTEFFGKMGLAYLEEPYVTCRNARTERWVDCQTPNLFMLGDIVKVRVHTVTDGKGQCLKATVSGLQKELPPRQIPENVPGPLNEEYSLGLVDEAMLAGVTSSISKVYGSNPGCQELIQIEGISPEIITSGKTVRFDYSSGADGKYRLMVPLEVTVEPSLGFGGAPGNPLTKDGVSDLPLTEINTAVFNLDGFKVRNVLGRATPAEPTACVYQVMGRSGTMPGTNYRDLSVRFDLMLPDETAGCYYTNQLVKTGMGKNSHTQSIRIQRESMITQELGGVHEAFIRGDYDYVAAAASNIINRRQDDLEEAVAIYYWAAVDAVKWSKAAEGKEPYVKHIRQLLDSFFKTDEEGNKADKYPAEVIEKSEYKKIKCYLCQIIGKLGISGYESVCSNVC